MEPNMSTDPRLEALRKRFEQQEQENKERQEGNSSYYPFFNMDFGKEAVIRFLPDQNLENPDYFLKQNNSHKFNINGKSEKTVCMKNYGHTNCPCCDASQSFYKSEGKESANGKLFYRKVQYLARVIVVKDPLPIKEGQESHEGKIRVVGLNRDFYAKIMGAITSASDPLPTMPDDLKQGFNFIIRKEKDGDYASYDNSGFARNPSPVSIAIDPEKDIIDLSTLLKKEPTFEEVEKRLQSGLTGEAYDDGSSAFRRANTGIRNYQSSQSETGASATTTNAVNSVTSTGSDDEPENNEFYAELLAKAEKRRESAGKTAK